MAGAHGQIWKKRILLPLWFIQLGALVIFLGLSAFALWVWNRVSDDLAEERPDLDVDGADSAIDYVNEIVYRAGAALNFAFAVFTILMVFVEMILLCTHRLSPVANLVMQCIKSAIWTFYLIITIIAAVKGISSGGGIFLVLVIFLTSMGLLGYAASMVHRKRKGTLYRGNYAAASTGGGPGVGYEPSHYNQTTGYTGASNPDPFRDPSPAPPYNPHATSPAHKPTGAAGEYYGGGGSYEMQHGAGR